MHLSYEDLLDVRDGQARPEAALHVAACPACAAEVERLERTAAALRALPVEEPPRDRWPAIRSALVRKHHQRRLAYAGYAALALAASLVLVAVLPRIAYPPGPASPFSQVGTPRAGAPPDSRSRTPGGEDLASLIGESQRLEGILRAMGSDPGVLDVRAASAVVTLEDEIAWVDQRLASPALAQAPRSEVRRLWQERVDLMSRLVRAREARPVYVGL